MRSCNSPAHLGDIEVDVEALPIALHLPHPHLAGQVTGAGADALQGEGAVQVLLRAIPDVIEGDLLGSAEEMSGVPSSSPLGAGGGLCQYLVADKQLALPQGAGHVMDGQAQVVVTVLEVQNSRLLNQLSTQLLLQLHHFLQGPGGQQSLGPVRSPPYCP